MVKQHLLTSESPATCAPVEHVGDGRSQQVLDGVSMEDPNLAWFISMEGAFLPHFCLNGTFLEPNSNQQMLSDTSAKWAGRTGQPWPLG